MLVMLIAERGGCLPAASMQWLLAAGNQPGGGGLFARFAQTAEPVHLQDPRWSLSLKRSMKPLDCRGHPSSALRAGAPIYARSAWMPMDPSGPFAVQATKNPRSLEGFFNPSTSSGTELVRPEGFEPPTNGFGSHYSIRLSYERLAAHYARTAGVRVMGPGDASPGEPRRRSRRDDAGVSARAVAARHRVPRFKRAGPCVQRRGHLKRPLLDASLLSTPPDSELEHAPERAHCQACVATAPPAAARPHQRPLLSVSSLARCGPSRTA